MEHADSNDSNVRFKLIFLRFIDNRFDLNKMVEYKYESIHCERFRLIIQRIYNQINRFIINSVQLCDEFSYNSL